jgi:hypothetical protein
MLLVIQKAYLLNLSCSFNAPKQEEAIVIALSSELCAADCTFKL